MAQGNLDGRVVIVTGSGRGLGFEYAKLMAAQGASVVINDIANAEDAAKEITAAGGRAVAIKVDVADWADAHRLIDETVAAFGALHVLVNNAGGGGGSQPILRTTEADWDHCIRNSLKAHFCPTRAAVAYWDRQAQLGKRIAASVINISSGAGLSPHGGRAGYGSARAGIAAFTLILADELKNLGVRVNAVSPAGRTRGIEASAAFMEFMGPPKDPNGFDAWAGRNVAPMVGYLATEACPITGEVFQTRGGVIAPMRGWRMTGLVTSDKPWTIEELAVRIPQALKDAPADNAPRDAQLDALQAAAGANAMAPAPSAAGR